MLNLGGLFFTLDADTRGLQTAQRRVERFATDVRQAFRGVASGVVAPQFANQLARQERAVVAMMERIKRVQNQVNSVGFKGRQLDEARAQLERLSNQYDVFTRKMAGGVPLNTLDFGRRMQHMRSQIDDTQRSINNMTKELISSRTAWGNATGIMHGLGSSALVVQGHFGGLSTRLFAFGNLVKETNVAIAATSVTIAGLATGMGLLTVHAIESGRAMERLQVGFNALTGNAAVANTELKFVKDVAQQAGLIFDDTAKAYQRFLASASGVISLEQTRDVFRGISLAAATMQLSVEDTQGVFRALDQMMSKGTVQAEELRGQLGDRLPGAFKIAAAAMGVSTKALGEMMKKGQVVSSEFVPKFTATLMRMWNIDPGKAINTLQASLNNLSNEWTYFGQALDKATGASRLFKTLIDTLVTSLQGIRDALPEILAGLGALTGAFVGLAGAMAITAVIQYVQTIWNLVAVYNVATRSIMLAATAQNIFNAAITRFPAAKIIGIIANLVISIGSAVIGYKAMQSAIESNNSALADLTGIEAYIAAQKAMGFQVRSTTVDMLNQLRAQMVTASNENMSKLADLKEAAAAYESLGRASATSGRASAEAGVAFGRAQSRFRGILGEVRTGTESVNRMRMALKGLVDVSALPAQAMPTMTPGGGGDSSKGSKLSDEIGRIDDMILKMQEAEAVLNDLGDAPGSRKLIEDLYEARRAINQLNPKQLGALEAALTEAGIGAGKLDERLAQVVSRTRMAEEATKQFISAWDDIETSQRKIATFSAQLNHLVGGGAVEGLDFFRDLEDAYANLKDMDKTPAGVKALGELQTKLRGLGIEIGNTGDILQDTAIAYATFFNQESRLQDQVREWSRLSEAIREAREDLGAIASQTVAYGTSGDGFMGAFFSADIGEEAAAAIERGRKVDEYRRKLIALGGDQTTVNEATTNYLNILRSLDDAAVVFDRVKAHAEANREALRGLVETGVTGFRDVVKGVKSLGDALMDVATNALDSLWERFIQMPLDDLLNNIGRNQGKKKTEGLDFMVAGMANASNDNDGTKNAVNGLASAANIASGALKGNLVGSLASTVAQTLAMTTSTAVATAATTAKGAAEIAAATQLMTTSIALTLFRTSIIQATAALIAMAASGGGEGGGGGGSSLFGAIVKGAGSIAKSIFSSAPGKALGGTALAGQVYQVNEPGLLGEYFIPSVNGTISNKAPANNNGGGPVSIDARTTIDARGASEDAIKRLEVMAARRDAALRAELPSMIDGRVRDSSNRGRYQ